MSERQPVEHYMRGGIETLDYIKAKLTREQYEGYLLGNVHKYLGRWQDKGGPEDLLKAQTYLGWLIELKK
jgi:hypothetical protein